MGESVNARVRGSQSRAAKSEEERMECRKRGERGGASRFGQDDGTGRCRGGIGVVSRAEECGVSVARPGGGFWVCEAGLSLGCGRSAIAVCRRLARLGREGLEWPGTGRLGLSDRMRVETEACRLDNLPEGRSVVELCSSADRRVTSWGRHLGRTQTKRPSAERKAFVVLRRCLIRQRLPRT